MIGAIAIFIACYLTLSVARRRRSIIAWAAVVVALAAGAIHRDEIIPSINWNVLGIFAGTLFAAELFVISKVPEAIAESLVNRSKNVGIAFLWVVVFSSALSAFIENVAVTLIVAPIALEVARKSHVSPVKAILAVAIASNLQGTATLVGDPPSMILGAAMKMNFLDFIFYYFKNGSAELKPGIFWFVEIGAVSSLFVLYGFFRCFGQKPEKMPVTQVQSLFPTILIVAMVVFLSLAGFVDRNFVWFGGTVCMVTGLVGVLWYGIADRGGARRILRGFDWDTAAFLAGVFVLVGMLESRGVIDEMVDSLAFFAGANSFVLYSMVVWGAVLLSAFVDNVPLVTAMLPVVTKLAPRLGVSVELLAFGLLIGACLGGNITPIGASANIVAVGLLRRQGYHVSFSDFTKMGLPFTVVATGTAFLVLWFVYR